MKYVPTYMGTWLSHLSLKVLDDIKKIYFLNNVISNLRLLQIACICDGIIDKSQVVQLEGFDHLEVTKLAPECQVFV